MYGSWTHSKEDLGDRPRCLHLFSGPQRPGDLAEQLKEKGWAVCSVDIKQPHPTDLLDQGVRQKILKDIRDKRYDHVYVGTPCETYSALREQQPGPRPLRSEEEIMGLSSGLTTAEQKQLKEGNLHTLYSAQVLKECFEAGVAFTMENPEPLKPVSIFNTPAFKEVARLMGVTYTSTSISAESDVKRRNRQGYFISRRSTSTSASFVATTRRKNGKTRRATRTRPPMKELPRGRGSTEKEKKNTLPRLSAIILQSSARC